MTLPKLMLYAFILTVTWIVGSIFVYLFEDEVTFAMRGETVDARVIAKMGETSRSQKGDSTSYHVEYEYIVDGVNHRNKDMLDVGRGYYDLRKGQVVEVVYDPRKPQTARTKLSSPIIRYSLLSIFILAMAGLFSMFPVYLLLRSNRVQFLKRGFISGEASITHPISSNFKINSKTAYRVRYAFRDHRGIEHHHKTGFLYRDDVHGYNVGDRVALRYGKSNPKISTIEMEFKKLGLA